MEITQRRVIYIRNGVVTYERVDEPTLVIERTVEQHVAALGKQPEVGDVVEFETTYDYDGSFNTFKRA